MLTNRAIIIAVAACDLGSLGSGMCIRVIYSVVIDTSKRGMCDFDAKRCRRTLSRARSDKSLVDCLPGCYTGINKAEALSVTTQENYKPRTMTSIFLHSSAKLGQPTPGTSKSVASNGLALITGTLQTERQREGSERAMGFRKPESRNYSVIPSCANDLAVPASDLGWNDIGVATQ